MIDLHGYTPQTTCIGGSDARMKGSSCDAITEFDDLTATRNRSRGIWVRASWYDLESPRLATNRDSVAVVSSGGTEGSPPGEWSRVHDAIAVGISTNNPNRFGPCPYGSQDGFGGPAGCYETIANAGNGYPDPQWNMFGVMFYDGPARIEHAQFVNFKTDPESLLTASDATYLEYFTATNNMLCDATVGFEYEGDAAMGWFQSNVNSYPPTQYTEGLEYENVDLRHEVYTQDVENTCGPGSFGAEFRDGDKFTVILDHDASLTGLEVVPPGGGSAISGAYPISLNNLPFLSGPGTIDECQSTGAADEAIELRPTSLISPYNYATLEFEALTGTTNDNTMVFNKDEIDYPDSAGGAQIQFTDQSITDLGNTYSANCGASADSASPGVAGHACVALSGRNGQGVYEPKLVNGLGYTVGAQYGMPNFVSLMYGDANLPGGISTSNPFHTRIGVCYKNEGAAAAPLASAFTVYKGSKSFAGPDVSPVPPQMAEYFQLLVACNTFINTPACPAAPFYYVSNDMPVTSTTQTALKEVTSISDLDDSSVCPNGTCYFYDQTSGLLFIDLVQEQPNAGASYTSPLGSCGGSGNMKNDPACAKEDFYSCPAGGCELYTIHANSSYTSNDNPSDCTPYGGANGETDYTQNYPADLNQLAYQSDDTVVTSALEPTMITENTKYPHQASTNEPSGLCPVNAPMTPDWPPAPSSAIPLLFTVGLPPSGVSATISINSAPVTPIPTTPPLCPLNQQTYTLTATANSGCPRNLGNNQYCQCQQDFTVTSTGWSSTGSNCCQLGTGGNNTTIGVAEAPYSCTGP